MQWAKQADGHEYLAIEADRNITTTHDGPFSAVAGDYLYRNENNERFYMPAADFELRFGPDSFDAEGNFVGPHLFDNLVGEVDENLNEVTAPVGIPAPDAAPVAPAFDGFDVRGGTVIGQ